MQMQNEELALGDLAHCQAACQVIGTAFMSLMATAPTETQRAFYSGFVDHIVATNSEAVATLEAVLLANDGELSKCLDVAFTVTF